MATKITADSILAHPGLNHSVQHVSDFSFGAGYPKFSRVDILSRDTANSNFSYAYKVYIAKGEGIIGYRMVPGDVLWVRE